MSSGLFSDPSLDPHNVIPVFQALTGNWEEIDSGSLFTAITVVPRARAQLFRNKLSLADQPTEAGKYYALYHPDASWKQLSVSLYRANETEALKMARPHIQTVTGTSYVHVYMFSCTHYLYLMYLVACTEGKMYSCKPPFAAPVDGRL